MPKSLIFFPGPSIHNNLFANFIEQIKASNCEYYLVNDSKNKTDFIFDLDINLNQYDYLILFLSAPSVISEMVTEIVRIAKKNQDIHPDKKPWIIPIIINIPVDLPWDYNLYSYLSKIHKWQWQSQDNPQDLVAKIITLIQTEVSPPLPETKSELIHLNSLTADNYNKYPLPSSIPKLPKNKDNFVSSFYIERPPIEESCYQEITKPGALIRIKAPRQMGKTSLMARILHHGSKLGYQTAALSLQLVDNQNFKNLDTFLRWFCLSVASELNLSANLDNYWNKIFGSKISCKSYFERYILKSIDTPIVLGLDEADRIFAYP